MNERIKELIKQAEEVKTHKEYTDTYGSWIKSETKILNAEKFAQLIVEEMYDFIIEESANDNGIPYLSKVKEHFGVEE